MTDKRFPDLSNYKTIAEVVADKIRQQIINGELTPNEKLSQEKLSKEFGVSRMPVRDALYKLEKEGLIIVSRRNGARVCMLSVDDLEEIYSIRMLLEGMGTREGVPRMTEEHLDILENIGQLADKAIDDNDVDQFLLMDRQFHFTPYKASGKLHLVELISNLWNATEHYRRMYVTQAGRLDVAKTSHSLYIEACQKRDIDRAEELAKQHLRETVKEISKFLINQ